MYLLLFPDTADFQSFPSGNTIGSVFVTHVKPFSVLNTPSRPNHSASMFFCNYIMPQKEELCTAFRRAKLFFALKLQQLLFVLSGILSREKCYDERSRAERSCCKRSCFCKRSCAEWPCCKVHDHISFQNCVYRVVCSVVCKFFYYFTLTSR